jgi:beta-glucanase (GH16 family)
MPGNPASGMMAGDARVGQDAPSTMGPTNPGRDSSGSTNALPDVATNPGLDASSSSDAASIDVNTAPDASPTEPPDGTGPDATTPDAAAPSDGGIGGDGARPGWRLVWSDEFNGPAGALPDAKNWTPQVGLNGANAELEFYTARPQNVSQDGSGNLVITARREAYMGAAYTSARLESGGKFEQMYGRFESRLKLPTGQGLWPAFWIMGNNAEVGWPARGEVDIMENFGRDPTTSIGALHGPGYSGATDFRATFMLAGGYSTDFHVFAVEWEPNVIRWYLDDNLFETRTPADLVARGGNLVWVYDHPFFIILNVAVGGRAPGNPDATTVFPQMLSVDYVRVYSR